MKSLRVLGKSAHGITEREREREHTNAIHPRNLLAPLHPQLRLHLRDENHIVVRALEVRLVALVEGWGREDGAGAADALRPARRGVFHVADCLFDLGLDGWILL